MHTCMHVGIIAGDQNKSIEWYHPLLNQWSLGTAMTHVHYQGVAITLNGRIHINGGWSGSAGMQMPYPYFIIV